VGRLLFFSPAVRQVRAGFQKLQPLIARQQVVAIRAKQRVAITDRLRNPLESEGCSLMDMDGYYHFVFGSKP